MGLGRGVVACTRASAALQTRPHDRVSLQNRVLWTKTHRVHRRYLASGVNVDVLAQREKLGCQHREKLLSSTR